MFGEDFGYLVFLEHLIVLHQSLVKRMRHLEKKWELLKMVDHLLLAYDFYIF